ncbi:hypothetical protein [Amycolatopsis thailandensis]|uniref:hypothetical protein n=1 Tax=Amycolatopsis thailandensis TaxID=589330 RepID=UPI0036314CDA
MANNTQVSEEEILAQAKAHDDTRAEIEQNLNSLSAFIANTLQASTSEATRALEQTFGNWVKGLRAAALLNLEEMSASMRSESSKATQADVDNSRAILSVPMSTGNFLGAS